LCPSPDGSDELRQLLDARAIRDVIARYALAIDTGDDTLLGTCFADGAVQVFDDGTRCTGRQAIIAYIRSVLAPIRSTMHLVPNTDVVLDGDRATARSWGTAHLVRVTEDRTEVLARGLRYDDELVRDHGRWRLLVRRHAAQWMVVQPAADRLSL
jgi:uncharacterized protein (TIGR02246 family)